VSVFAHPTGNMITVGKHVLWSYINPIDDSEHHACVMIWSEGSEPEVLMTSVYAASDFMLYTNQKDIYIIERRHLQASQQFEIRILKTAIGKEPKVIWDWMEDKWRIGEGGFFMVSDHQIVFARYPNIYCMDKGKVPTPYFEFHKPISGMRFLANNQMLLLGNNSCWLVQQDGKIINQWDDLIDETVKNAPLNRNRIFDVDYHNEELLLAYWGKRSFEIIDKFGHRKTLLQQQEPFTPHWVAFFGEEKLLFSSKLVFNGETPKPNLIKVKLDGNTAKVW